MKKLFFLFLVSSGLCAQNNQTQIESDAEISASTPIQQDEATKQLPAAWFISYNFSNTMPKEIWGSAAFSYSFKLKDSFSLTPRIYAGNSEEENDPDLDYRMRSSNDKKLVVIGDKTNYRVKEAGIELLLGKNFPQSTKFAIEPYLGLGFGKGSLDASREIRTASDSGVTNCSSGFFGNIFNNCNIYLINTSKDYLATKLIVGSNYTWTIVKSLVTFGVYTDYQYRMIKYKNNSYDQMQTQGTQGAKFAQDMFHNENVAEHIFRLGAGARF